MILPSFLSQSGISFLLENTPVANHPEQHYHVQLPIWVTVHDYMVYIEDYMVDGPEIVGVKVWILFRGEDPNADRASSIVSVRDRGYKLTSMLLTTTFNEREFQDAINERSREQDMTFTHIHE